MSARDEPWQRGPLPGIPDALQPAAHAIVGAHEELDALARDLGPDELWARPAGLASVGFHVAHVGGVLDRLFTYARGAALDETQRAALKVEGQAGDPPRDAATLLAALGTAVAHALDHLRAVDPATLAEPRTLGRRALPTTVGGLLFHAAEHAQRHTGQALVTARVVRAFGLAAHETHVAPRSPVTGLGGVFFKARDPDALRAWYRTHLGIDARADLGGSADFPWRDAGDPATVGHTYWSLFRADTTYFAPSEAPFMLNYRVADLDVTLARLRAAGVWVDEKGEVAEYGRFGWIMDPEGNRIELWEPPPNG